MPLAEVLSSVAAELALFAGFGFLLFSTKDLMVHLTNQEEVNKLVQMNSDTTSNYPDFKGTPTFILNGEMVDLGPVTEAELWPALEKRLQQAIGG